MTIFTSRLVAPHTPCCPCRPLLVDEIRRLQEEQKKREAFFEEERTRLIQERDAAIREISHVAYTREHRLKGRRR